MQRCVRAKVAAKERGYEEQNYNVALGGLLYGLTVTFPSWAGAIVVLYALLSYGLAALNLLFR
jgi:hypothetical protein